MQTLLRRVRWKAILVAGAVLVGAIIGVLSAVIGFGIIP